MMIRYMSACVILMWTIRVFAVPVFDASKLAESIEAAKTLSEQAQLQYELINGQQEGLSERFALQVDALNNASANHIARITGQEIEQFNTTLAAEAAPLDFCDTYAVSESLEDWACELQEAQVSRGQTYAENLFREDIAEIEWVEEIDDLRILSQRFPATYEVGETSTMQVRRLRQNAFSHAADSALAEVTLREELSQAWDNVAQTAFSPEGLDSLNYMTVSQVWRDRAVKQAAFLAMQLNAYQTQQIETYLAALHLLQRLDNEVT